MDKLHANLPGAKVPLNIFSSWGGVSCHVKLTTTPGFLIRLTVSSFLIEPSHCVSDALTVYDTLLPMRGRILHRCAASLGLFLHITTSTLKTALAHVGVLLFVGAAGCVRRCPAPSL